MYRHKLTEVPENILVKPSDVASGTKWQSDYNVAAWFRFDQVTLQMIRLHLHWKDSAGEHSLCVDQTEIDATSLLLSGIGRLKITGPLENLAIFVESEKHDYQVDELFVQPARTASELSRKVGMG